jgi:outer membrane beta-barrel protein
LIALLVATIGLPGVPATAQAEEGQDDIIVRTRAPREKKPPKVRNKFFYKSGRIEITPQFGWIATNPLNTEVQAGARITYHFNERLGFEFEGSYAFLGGAANTNNLARAVLNLATDSDPSFHLESTDPGALLTGSLVWSPMYGKLNPFGIAIINLDFFFVLGAGYANEQIEMLVESTDALGGTVAVLGILPDGTPASEINHQFVFHLGFGANVFMTKFFSVRLEGRLYFKWDEILDFSTDTLRTRNTNIRGGERFGGAARGSLANRLDCHDADPGNDESAVCRTEFSTRLVLGLGVSFWAPDQEKARASMKRRR